MLFIFWTTYTASIIHKHVVKTDTLIPHKASEEYYVGNVI